MQAISKGKLVHKGCRQACKQADGFTAKLMWHNINDLAED